MPTTDSEQLRDLNDAIEEAIVVGLEVDADRRFAAITFELLSLPEVGPALADRRVQFVFRPTGRIAADGYLKTDPALPARVVASLNDLSSLGFGGAVYGREFFDVHDTWFAERAPAPSLDWRSGTDGLAHSVTLFQEGSPDDELDLCIWFDEVRLFAPDFQELAIADVVAGARRWWNAWAKDDPRTAGLGIVRLRE